MDKPTTRELSRVLEHTHGAGADEFVKANADTEFEYFYQFMNKMIADKDLDAGRVIKRSGINSNYVYNILNGNRLNPGRDKMISLCIAAGLSYKETQRGLEIAGAAPLYPKNERDSRIAVAINDGITSVCTVNIMLSDHDLEPLKV